MALVSGGGMNPDSVTVTGGALQYWTNASTTDDGWHNTELTNWDGLPFTVYDAFFGRNGNGVYHNAALCFKTGSFTGKGKHIYITFTGTQSNFTNGVGYAAQLSKHDWSTATKWRAGSKGYYSAVMTYLPNDPAAIASKQGTVPYSKNEQAVTISLDADISPNTEYVLYIIGTGTQKSMNVMVKQTGNSPLTITVTK